jgi:hypothetical protein
VNTGARHRYSSDGVAGPELGGEQLGEDVATHELQHGDGPSDSWRTRRRSGRPGRSRDRHRPPARSDSAAGSSAPRPCSCRCAGVSQRRSRRIRPTRRSPGRACPAPEAGEARSRRSRRLRPPRARADAMPRRARRSASCPCRGRAPAAPAGRAAPPQPPPWPSRRARAADRARRPRTAPDAAQPCDPISHRIPPTGAYIHSGRKAAAYVNSYVSFSTSSARSRASSTGP